MFCIGNASPTDASVRKENSPPCALTIRVTVHRLKIVGVGSPAEHLDSFIGKIP
jgi:hypothetical protein